MLQMSSEQVAQPKFGGIQAFCILWWKRKHALYARARGSETGGDGGGGHEPQASAASERFGLPAFLVMMYEASFGTIML